MLNFSWKKSFFTLGLLLSVLLVLAACGNGDNNGIGETRASESNGEDTEGTNVEDSDWMPERIDVTIPLSPGGGVERRARVIAKHFENIHGIPLNIHMREGGGTVVGTNYFLDNAEHDGTHVYINWEYAFTGGVYRDAPYSIKDFATLAGYTDIHLGLMVSADSPFETFHEFVEYVRDNPGSVSMGGTTGSTDQILTEAFSNHFDLDINFVPFDGGGGVRSALAGGHIDAAIVGAETAWSAFGEDEMRTLTLFTDQENELAPSDEITYIRDEIEEHYPNMDVPDTFTDLTNWHFIAVSAEMREEYPERYEKLIDLFEEVISSDQLAEEALDNYWIPNPVMGDDAYEHWEWVNSIAEENAHLFQQE